MNQPQEHNFTTYLAYTRAMEDYIHTVQAERDALKAEIERLHTELALLRQELPPHELTQ